MERFKSGLAKGDTVGRVRTEFGRIVRTRASHSRSVRRCDAISVTELTDFLGLHGGTPGPARRLT